eukprot:Skav211997  [mRNA]  locus=scaffold304:57024:62672:+ [translate_table: standard]
MLPMPMPQSTTDPSKYTKVEEAAHPARQTWGAATSDALSKRYTARGDSVAALPSHVVKQGPSMAVANDENQSAQKREATGHFAGTQRRTAARAGHRV